VSHARQVIREYVAVQIGGFGVPVYVGKVWLEDASDLPAINIVTTADVRNSEYARTVQAAPAVYHEVFALALDIEIRAMASADILDALDDIAEQVQAALSVDPTWGDLAKAVRLQGTEVDLSSELQMPTGMLTMSYAVDYEIDMRAPTAPL